MMKLSEAMRLGAMIRPQEFGQFYGFLKGFGSLSPGIVTSCALGAAFEAIGMINEAIRAHEIEGKAGPEEWTWMGHKEVNCPARAACLDGCVAELITHLNDYHRWTREAIADWLEPIELEHERSLAIQGEAELELVGVCCGN